MTASGKPVSPVRRVRREAWRRGEITAGYRTIPEEVAVALTYNRFSYAVMMSAKSSRSAGLDIITA